MCPQIAAFRDNWLAPRLPCDALILADVDSQPENGVAANPVVPHLRLLKPDGAVAIWRLIRALGVERHELLQEDARHLNVKLPAELRTEGLKAAA